LKNLFVQKLVHLHSNQAGSKHFVPGSFIAFPEKYLENPLVIDSFLMGKDQQVLIQVQEENSLPIIDIQSTICIQHMVGKDYCLL